MLQVPQSWDHSSNRKQKPQLQLSPRSTLPSAKPLPCRLLSKSSATTRGRTPSRKNIGKLPCLRSSKRSNSSPKHAAVPPWSSSIRLSRARVTSNNSLADLSRKKRQATLPSLPQTTSHPSSSQAIARARTQTIISSSSSQRWSSASTCLLHSRRVCLITTRCSSKAC